MKKQPTFIRACKLTLKFATATKRRRISAMLESYRAAVNFYIREMWPGDQKYGISTIRKLVHSRLPANLRNVACWQAQNIIKALRAAEKETKDVAGMPHYRGGANLVQTAAKIDDGKGSFDLTVTISSLKSGSRIVIPTKKTKRLNYWLEKPGAKLCLGCYINDKCIIVFVEVPLREPKQNGKTMAVDIGINKLLVDSDGTQYGKELKAIYAKIGRRKPGSKGKSRARAERKNIIEREAKHLPWNNLSVIGVENLKNLKFGKSKKRNKKFRKATTPWTYRHALDRIEQLAQENRVRLVRYNPAYTSQICPVCGKCSKTNRKGETFKCVRCGHTADADLIGAQNGLVRTLRILGGDSSPSGFPPPPHGDKTVSWKT